MLKKNSKEVMNQVSTYNHTDQGMPEAYPMKKSDIVIAIITLRSGVAPSVKRIMNELSIALKHRSLTLENWNHDVDSGLTQRIVKHVGSVKGQLSMQGMIADIDILLRRSTSQVGPRALAQAGIPIAIGRQ